MSGVKRNNFLIIVDNLMLATEFKEAITAADRVLVHIRTAIVEGEIPAGTKISEPELARRYDALWEDYLAELKAAGKTRDPNESIVKLML